MPLFCITTTMLISLQYDLCVGLVRTESGRICQKFQPILGRSQPGGAGCKCYLYCHRSKLTSAYLGVQEVIHRDKNTPQGIASSPRHWPSQGEAHKGKQGELPHILLLSLSLKCPHGSIQAVISHQITVGLAEGTLIMVDTYDGEILVQNSKCTQSMRID